MKWVSTLQTIQEYRLDLILFPSISLNTFMKTRTNNLVAKHVRKFNKAAVHADRKKQARRGIIKHKGKLYEAQL